MAGRRTPMQHLTEADGQGVIAHIKSKTPAKAPLPDWDYDRKLSWDTIQINGHAMEPMSRRRRPTTPMRWGSIAVCNLRLLYVPWKGSAANHMQNQHPKMVARMLSELHTLMEGARPTAAICLAMMEKVVEIIPSVRCGRWNS